MIRENMEIAMGEVMSSVPVTPRPPASVAPTPPIVSLPPSQFHSPSLTRSPLLNVEDDQSDAEKITTKTPNKSRSITPRFITPLGSPLRKALKLTKLDPQDACLPITESRNGNAYYAAFHTLCSGIGIQALVLPVAFTFLGWTWGIICLTLAFTWQLYTLYLLVQLHENLESGIRYSRYMQLATATFGEKLANLLAAFPIMYLSSGTCVANIVLGGATAKMLYQTLSGAWFKVSAESGLTRPSCLWIEPSRYKETKKIRNDTNSVRIGLTRVDSAESKPSHLCHGRK